MNEKRTGRAKWLAALAVGLFMVFQFACSFSWLAWSLPEHAHFDKLSDLRYRRNEICCAHQGVNSFRIWNHEVSLPGFTPLPRPDMEDLPHKATDAVVHAYPPWHTALFYFYGWMSDSTCHALMLLVFGICFAFSVEECRRLSEERFEHPGLVSCCALALMMAPAVWCYFAVQYGFLILAALLLMNRALERDRNVAAGLLWSVMMIKPQVGLLFFWPLFWHRRYLAIAVAVATCLAETFVTSLLVHESMLDLILQIPQIGKPYGACMAADLLRPFFGESSPIVVMIAFFVLTGVACWVFRKNRDFLVSCVPVVLAIPLWTYSMAGYDRVILLPAYIFLAGKMFSSRRFGVWWLLGVFYCATSGLIELWRLVTTTGLLDERQLPFGFNSLALLLHLTAFLFLVLLLLEECRRTRLESDKNREMPRPCAPDGGLCRQS